LDLPYQRSGRVRPRPSLTITTERLIVTNLLQRRYLWDAIADVETHLASLAWRRVLPQERLMQKRLGGDARPRTGSARTGPSSHRTNPRSLAVGDGTGRALTESTLMRTPTGSSTGGVRTIAEWTAEPARLDRLLAGEAILARTVEIRARTDHGSYGTLDVDYSDDPERWEVRRRVRGELKRSQ
jgi:hypothetical protein